MYNIKVEEDVMGGACSTNGAKRNAYRLWGGSQRERGHYEDQDIGKLIILIWILGK
jgi:hypothetical protein